MSSWSSCSLSPNWSWLHTGFLPPSNGVCSSPSLSLSPSSPSPPLPPLIYLLPCFFSLLAYPLHLPDLPLRERRHECRRDSYYLTGTTNDGFSMSSLEKCLKGTFPDGSTCTHSIEFPSIGYLSWSSFDKNNVFYSCNHCALSVPSMPGGMRQTDFLCWNLIAFP